MYQHFIITVTAIIAALSLAAQLNYLPPAQPVEEIERPSLLYQVRAEPHKVQDSALYGVFRS